MAPASIPILTGLPAVLAGAAIVVMVAGVMCVPVGDVTR